MILHPPPGHRSDPWQKNGSNSGSSQHYRVYHHGVFEPQDAISQANSTTSFASTQSSNNLSKMVEGSPRWIMPSKGTFGSSSLRPSPAPPPNNRSLYATVPLPPVSVDDEWGAQDGRASLAVASRGQWGVSSSVPLGPTAPNPNPRHIPPPSSSFPKNPTLITLHPILETVCLSARQIPAQATQISLNAPSSPVYWTRHCHEPATTPGVSYLAVQVYSTAECTTIYPNSTQSPHTVCVGDVLAALEPFFFITDRPCDGRCQSVNQTGCDCDGITLTMNSLQLWWDDADQLAPQGHRPWQLVIGRR